jgi:hypothetical protein
MSSAAPFAPGESLPTSGQRPWLWQGAGFFACLVAAVAAVATGAESAAARITLVTLGLILTGVAVVQQFRQTQPNRSAQTSGLLLPFLTLVFGVMAIAVTVNLFASWFGEYLLGLRPGLALILWLLLAPLSADSTWQCLQRMSAPRGADRREHAALSLLAASVAAFLGAFAVAGREPEHVADWFTLVHFLYILGLVAVAAAPLTAASDSWRRRAITGLIVFHFLGIFTATLGSGPQPWLISQVWTRIYRPYLEFLYLNNAYHFYSPEPGPASFLWFRLYYAEADGKEQAEWFKVPKINDKGEHGHPTSMLYQRYLSLTEHTIHREQFVADNPDFEAVAKKRWKWTPEGAKQEQVVGDHPTKQDILVPVHPNRTPSQQYFGATDAVKRVLASYTRHLLRQQAEEHPERRYTSVRVYRVMHDIPAPMLYQAGWSPTDPQFYTPIYMGEYGADGKLRDPSNALLYWVLPILRDPPEQPESPIRDWCRRHAGDPYWIRILDKGFPLWVNDQSEAAPDTKTVKELARR